MAKIIHTGGPAFPFNHFDLGATEHGMSLRDYFAAKAMQAFLIELYLRPDDLQNIAVLAYRQADAMLEVRKS
jgi:hypothetical protein